MEVLRLQGITKQFAGVTVLDHVDFTLAEGEVHALLGENGAGKSTLIKILAGVHKRDGGLIYLRGDPVHSSDELPIGFIHQDLGLAGALTVAENIGLVVGYPTRLGLIDWRELVRRSVRILSDMGADIDPREKVERLGAAERAIVAIARAVYLKRPLMVLDEPTAALPESEVARLLSVIHRVKAQGVGVVYVTHRLDEVFRVADRVTVLRDGREVHSARVEDVTKDQLIQKITGRTVQATEPTVSSSHAEPLLSVRDLVSGSAGPATFDVYPGEVVGLVGLRGAGQSRIARAIYGAAPRSRGQVFLGDTVLPADDVRAAVRLGVGFVSNNRSEESLALKLSLRENLFPSSLLRGKSSARFAIPRGERRDALDTLKRFAVRPPVPERSVESLSGGNQQKVVLARWLSFPGRLLILDEPTFGVDVGSREEIYKSLQEATRQGLGVLIVSSDMEEVASVCSRALIVQRGQVREEVHGRSITPEQLTALIAGSAH